MFVTEVACVLNLCLMALRKGQQTVADYFIEFGILKTWLSGQQMAVLWPTVKRDITGAVVVANLQHHLSTTTEGLARGTSHLLLSSKNQGSPLLREMPVSPTTLSPHPNRQVLHAHLLLPGDTHTLAMLGDPGAEAHFIARKWHRR